MLGSVLAAHRYYCWFCLSCFALCLCRLCQKFYPLAQAIVRECFQGCKQATSGSCSHFSSCMFSEPALWSQNALGDVIAARKWDVQRVPLREEETGSFLHCCRKAPGMLGTVIELKDFLQPCASCGYLLHHWSQLLTLVHQVACRNSTFSIRVPSGAGRCADSSQPFSLY